MENRCFGCACKFTMLRKQQGCRNCGRSFCGSCLSRTAVVGKLEKKPQKVCITCFDALTKQGDSASASRPTPDRSPPANYKKRVAALQARQDGRGAGPSAGRLAFDTRGMSAEDREIAERLDKLKAGAQPTSSTPTQGEIEQRLAALRQDGLRDVPSVQEMEERLARLQGRPAPCSVGRPVHQPPDSRTQTEKANSLLAQFSEEVAIDGRFKPPTISSDDINDLNKGTRDGVPLSTPVDEEGGVSKALEEETRNVLAVAQRELEFEARGREDSKAIARRLAVLKGEDPDKVVVQNLADSDSDDDNEEKAVHKLLKQFGEEADMDRASGISECSDQGTAMKASKSSSRLPNPAASALPSKKTSRGVVAAAPLRPSDNDSGSDDELPWCCICNEDAVLRCRGCDGDLYCKRCYREGHDKNDRPDHPTETYKPNKKKLNYIAK